MKRLLQIRNQEKILFGRDTGVWRDSYGVWMSYTSNQMIAWDATVKKLLNTSSF